MQELLTLHEHLSSPKVLVRSVLLIFSELCCVVLFFCFDGLCPVSALCTQCCQCLWILQSLKPLRFSLTFICLVCFRPVSCVPNVASVSELSILECSFGLLYLCVLCFVYPVLPGCLDCSFLF